MSEVSVVAAACRIWKRLVDQQSASAANSFLTGISTLRVVVVPGSPIRECAAFTKLRRSLRVRNYHKVDDASAPEPPAPINVPNFIEKVVELFCEDTEAHLRSKAIGLLMVDCCARAEDLQCIDVDKVEFSSSTMTLHFYGTKKHQGEVDTLVLNKLPPRWRHSCSVTAVQNYMDKVKARGVPRGKTMRANLNKTKSRTHSWMYSPLFVTVKQVQSAPSQEPLKTDTISKVVRTVLKALKVPCQARTLRSASVSHLFNHGVNKAICAKQGRWKSVRTMMERYIVQDPRIQLPRKPKFQCLQRLMRTSITR